MSRRGGIDLATDEIQLSLALSKKKSNGSQQYFRTPKQAFHVHPFFAIFLFRQSLLPSIK